MSKQHLQPWEVIARRPILEAKPWMEVSVLEVRLPNGKVVDDFHQITLQDYVIIYAETPEGTVLAERQYKQGVGRVNLTLPSGGMLEGEAPLATAQRELLEETGYAGGTWQKIGAFVIHGNYGCGTAHVFKVKGVQLVAEPDSGDLEEMEILLKTPEELFQAVLSGEVALLGSATAVALATNPLLTDESLNGREIKAQRQTAD